MGKKKQEMGLYVEAVVHGHGCHEIVCVFDVPIDKAKELDALFKSRPDLFTPRNT